jgi:23S rRNA pseudouridine2605 synthase
MSQERLQKILARAGIASRRSAEELVSAGRVTVDGRRVTELGAKADPRRQRVELDGKLIEAEPLLYVLFHKPRQVMCTLKDPEGRPTVLDFMPDVGGRVVPVGRLDYHTSGVLLLTNDGDFAQALAHPTQKVEKVYIAKVNAPFESEELERWSQPIEIDGKMTRPALVKKLRTEDDKVWIEIRIHEGRNRQVHRIGEAAGSRVLRLARISFAGVTHDGVRPGQWRYLSKDELTQLKKVYGVPAKIYAAPPLPNARAVRRVRSAGEGKGQLAVVPVRRPRRSDRTDKSERTERPTRASARAQAKGRAGQAPTRGRDAVQAPRAGRSSDSRASGSVRPSDAVRGAAAVPAEDVVGRGAAQGRGAAAQGRGQRKGRLGRGSVQGRSNAQEQSGTEERSGSQRRNRQRPWQQATEVAKGVQDENSTVRGPRGAKSQRSTPRSKKATSRPKGRSGPR